MPQSEQTSEVIFTRKLGWMPFVVRKGDALFLELGAGADANHEPRTFNIPINEAQLEVIKSDLARHILLWIAIIPLCDAAGTSDPIDEAAAVALCDTILLGPEADVVTYFKDFDKRSFSPLVAHHADTGLLAEGELFAATKNLTAEADPELSKEYIAKQHWLGQGVTFTPLDEAILRYGNQYFHGGGVPTRNPELTNPELLPKVLEIIATAEKASAGMELPDEWTVGDGSWEPMERAITDALKQVYPDLHEKAVYVVRFLLLGEAADRARARRKANE